MYLVLVTALVAVCGADKLDRTYLPPASAHSAGGSPGSLQTPFRSFNQGLGGLPTGGYRNEFDGVVVDAAAPGTRASEAGVSGLGGPRISYGSTDSKVGEAAFTGDAAFPRVGVHSSNRGALDSSASGPERIQTSRDRASNTVKYENEVSHDSFNYAFETDNGILAEENGVEVNGVKAQGGYSYTGDDGQVYSVTYTADEEGYRPRGDHLPTPPPIPAEILKSLEQNAKEEAAGIVDDGSYDAQKYNTGEDYTKSDRTNEKYNAPTRLGSKPQSDAVLSSSFISQNNQAFAKPDVNQFGPTVKSFATVGGLKPFDSSKNVASISNIGIVSNADKTAYHGQAFGFGSGSNNEYLPPASNDGRPGISSGNQPFSVQSQQQNSAYNTGTFSINNAGNKDQNNEKTFIPLSQQNLQSDNFKKPQGSSPVFGRPTVIDSTLSIKDPFASRPSGNRFTQNKQTSQKPLNNGQIGGSFEVVSGNVYSSKNEYLPPQSQVNKLVQKENEGFQTSSFGSPTNEHLTGLKPQYFGISSNKPAATAFASASKPTFGFQSQINSGQKSIQSGGSGLPDFGQTSNSHLNSNNGQPQFTSSPTSFTNSNRVSQTQYKLSTFVSQYPTTQPQTELTTPLESNSNEKGYSPFPVIDSPGSPSLGSTFSSQSSFGAKPTSSFFGQSTFNKFQQASPTQASASAFGSIGAPTASGLQRPGSFVGNAGAQFLNKSPFDAQFSSNTPKPSFTQNTQEQGLDDSYYYNTPSKPFNIPTGHPQASQFPSSSSNQPFKVTQTPFGAKPGSFDFSQTSFASQTGSTRYPKPSTLEPISPTLPSSNTFQSQFNKVTQASVSSFPSPNPTPAADFPRNQFGQITSTTSQQSGSKFIQGQQSLFNKPSSSFSTIQPAGDQNANQGQPDFGKQDSTPGSSSQLQQTQQYNGEIYQYNKPPQTPPAPQNAASGQSLQQDSSSSQTSGSYKPSSQFGSQFTQQSFGQTQQSSLGNQAFNNNGQFESHSVTREPFGMPFGNSGQIQQSESGPSSPLKPTTNFPASPGNQAFSIDAQGQYQSSSRPSSNSRPVQGASKFPPAYSKENVPDCCKTTDSESQSSQVNQENKAPQFGTQTGAFSGFGVKEPVSQGTRPIQSVSSFAGVGETFGGPRKPPSFDASGYHY